MEKAGYRHCRMICLRKGKNYGEMVRKKDSLCRLRHDIADNDLQSDFLGKQEGRLFLR